MSESPRITVTAVRLSARFIHVINLLDDPNVLRNILLKQGYFSEGPQGMKSPAGVEVVALGKIATKEDLEVHYNPDKQVILMAGNNQKKVLAAFTELIKSIGNTIKNAKSNMLFYEILLTAFGEGSKNPLEAFASENNKSNTSLNLSDLFEESVSPFGLRVSPSRKPINNTDWFEYRIEPYLYQPERLYNVVYVYRNKNLDRVTQATSKFEEITKKIILMLESQPEESVSKRKSSPIRPPKAPKISPPH